MWPAFENALARHAELEILLADGDVIADRSRYTKLAKEHGALLKMVKPYVEYRDLAAEIAQAEALVAEADAEMRVLIEEELTVLRPRLQALHDRLEDLLLAEGEDYGSIIMEIRAGTGGDEAAIFAGDLYRMYTRKRRPSRAARAQDRDPGAYPHVRGHGGGAP
jgi:peptide chain release factor 1